MKTYVILFGFKDDEFIAIEIPENLKSIKFTDGNVKKYKCFKEYFLLERYFELFNKKYYVVQKEFNQALSIDDKLIKIVKTMLKFNKLKIKECK